MEALTIDLTYDIRHFRDIYYPGGKSSLFAYRPSRKAIILAGLSLLITSVIYFLSMSVPGMSWLIVLSILLNTVAVIYLISTVVQFARWKNPIEKFLKDLSKYRSFKLVVTDATVELSFDKDLTIDKWDTIKSAVVTDKYIILYKGDIPVYIFPAKSMMAAEFERIKEIVKAKLKDCTSDVGFITTEKKMRETM